MMTNMSDNNDDKTFRLSDAVLFRIVQIVQEGMLMQQDVTAKLRDIELLENDDTGLLDLTVEYTEAVKSYHDSLVDQANRLQLGAAPDSVLVNEMNDLKAGTLDDGVAGGKSCKV